VEEETPRASASSALDENLSRDSRYDSLNGIGLSPAPGWLIGRSNALADPSAVAEELYLSVHSRRPTAEERAEVASYLASRTTNLAKTQNLGQEHLAALRELAWGLLASTEFRFNH